MDHLMNMMLNQILIGTVVQTMIQHQLGQLTDQEAIEHIKEALDKWAER